MSSLVQVVFSSVSFKWAGFRRKLGIGKDRELSLLMMAPKMDILAIIMRKIGQWHERRNKTLRYRYLTLCEIVVWTCISFQFHTWHYYNRLLMMMMMMMMMWRCLVLEWVWTTVMMMGLAKGPHRTVPLFHLDTTAGGLVGRFFVIDHYMLVFYVTKEKTTGIVEKSF